MNGRSTALEHASCKEHHRTFRTLLGTPSMTVQSPRFSLEAHDSVMTGNGLMGSVKGFTGGTAAPVMRACVTSTMTYTSAINVNIDPMRYFADGMIAASACTGFVSLQQTHRIARGDSSVRGVTSQDGGIRKLS